MSTQIKYAYKRHNTWVYRRTYPKHLQHLLGSSLKQSLKTADAKTAKARVAELNQTKPINPSSRRQSSMFLQILAKLLPTLPTTLFESLWLALDITMLVLWVSGW